MIGDILAVMGVIILVILVVGVGVIFLSPVASRLNDWWQDKVDDWFDKLDERRERE